jgi:hypothetical protein
LALQSLSIGALLLDGSGFAGGSLTTARYSNNNKGNIGCSLRRFDTTTTVVIVCHAVRADGMCMTSALTSALTSFQTRSCPDRQTKNPKLVAARQAFGFAQNCDRASPASSRRLRSLHPRDTSYIPKVSHEEDCCVSILLLMVSAAGLATAQQPGPRSTPQATIAAHIE